MGFAKRDILTSRVESARDAQQDAKEEITDALAQFRKVVEYQGDELEARYKSLAAQLEDSEAAADAVHKRIAAVEDVAAALFAEWNDELQQYSSPSLRSKSEQQLRLTRTRYGEVMRVDTEVGRLVAELNTAIAEADRFTADLAAGAN